MAYVGERGILESLEVVSAKQWLHLICIINTKKNWKANERLSDLQKSQQFALFQGETVTGYFFVSHFRHLATRKTETGTKKSIEFCKKR